MSRPAPNTRVQRTRSSPSAPHSPLTRHPLGRMKALLRHLAIVVPAIVAPGCAHERAAPLQGPVECSCATGEPELANSAVLWVRACDDRGNEMSAVSVSVDGPVWGDRPPLEWRTNPSDPLLQPLQPGMWNVRASFPIFETYTAALSLPPGQVCMVRFRMQLESKLQAQMQVVY